jgi:hypothetical protein
VIRGGGGVFMFPVSNPSYNVNSFSQPASMPVSLDSFATAHATLANPFPDGFLQPTGSSLGIATSLDQSFSYYNPTLRNPYSIRWEFDLQRIAQAGRARPRTSATTPCTCPSNRNMDATPAQLSE